MRQAVSPNHRAVMLLAALVAAGTVAAFTGGTASAAGRKLDAAFCHTSNRCISLTFDGTTTTSDDRTDFTLRPGTYWLTLNDDSSFHNFELRGPGGLDEELTTVGGTGTVTIRVHLTHGSYTLYCGADDHEGDGMYVDFEVGGVGQVG